MHISKMDELHRRAFLKRSAQMGAMGAAAPFALNMSLINDAAAFTGTGPYKALVCLFLLGGNDHDDTLIPYDDANYNLYSAIRGGGAGQTAGGIARAKADLAATALTPVTPQTLTNDMQYALHPAMTRMKARWDQGRLATLLNVGTLIRPTTLAEYRSSNRVQNPLPFGLFSHNDQQSVWQSSAPEGALSGWGGRLADIALSSNTNTIFTAISAAGNSVFLTGQSALAYQVSGSGAIRLRSGNTRVAGSTTAYNMMREIMMQPDPSAHIFEGEYNRVTKRSIDSEGVYSAGVNAATLNTSFAQNGATSGIAAQLRIVARTIAARQALGVNRQVFFVTMGGYDHHDALMGGHNTLLGQLDFAMDAFYQATVEMGIADNVTLFTASDFGRTLSSNGDGSDHGWGGHHFMLGGGVRGGRHYGIAPEVSTTGSTQVGQGRLLPTTSVDQYGATLSNWLGASAGELSTVFPNIGNFSGVNLGFMN
ncbi:MAG TPA: DUF1501 domain-containing protein [Sphingorhabdus sp.]|jgi:uncharacterized protein (DUF1501 family)|nr:DUF1501 domain-containing protein [Sphingorhabdus sp.]